MKKSYKITKYNPQQEHHNEWTSLSDIKSLKEYQQYLNVETNYINSVIKICDFLNVESLKIKDLEIKNELSTNYKNEENIQTIHIDEIIRSILREKIWCKLTNEKCEFHFGYDYYMYAVSNTDLDSCFNEINQNLYIEEFESPYL